VSLLLGLITGSMAGSVIFLAMLLLRPITGKIFSESWHYYCLLIPLIFLLGGTHAAASLRNPDIAAENTPNTSQAVPISFEHGFIMHPDNHRPDMPVRDAEVTADPLPGYFLSYLEAVVPFLLAVWGLGAILFTVTGIAEYLKYRRSVLRNAVSVIDIKIPVVVSATAHTPMLLGVIKPIIVLPDMYFTYEELNMVLAHEMMHYKRKDLLVKLLMFIANAVHWFNPVVYALNRQLNVMCELSCDEKVVLEMNRQNKKLYGETILQVLKHSTTQRNLTGNVFFATNLCNSKKNFKRRLISMMNAKKMKKSVAALALATGFLFVAGGFVASDLMGFSVSAAHTAWSDFRQPEITINVMPNAAGAIPDALSSDEAALTGARYIWDVFGESIDGKTVMLSYSDSPFFAETRWEGMVAGAQAEMPPSESGGVSSRTLFERNVYFSFTINAVTGERIDILRIQEDLPEPVSERMSEIVWEFENPTEEGLRFLASIAGGASPDSFDLNAYSLLAKDYASRHFVNTEPVGVEFRSIGSGASRFDFDENGELFITSRTLNFEVTDSTERVVHVAIDEATRELISIRHNDMTGQSPFA